MLTIVFIKHTHEIKYKNGNDHNLKRNEFEIEIEW